MQFAILYSTSFGGIFCKITFVRQIKSPRQVRVLGVDANEILDFTHFKFLKAKQTKKKNPPRFDSGRVLLDCVPLRTEAEGSQGRGKYEGTEGSVQLRGGGVSSSKFLYQKSLYLLNCHWSFDGFVVLVIL